MGLISKTRAGYIYARFGILLITMKQSHSTNGISEKWHFGRKTIKEFALKRPTISFLVTYTLLFVIIFSVAYSSFCFSGKSFFRSFDGLDQHYLYFVYVGKWLREIARGLITTGQLVIPMWNTGIGFGGDPITTMGAYLGDPFNWISVIIRPEYAEDAFNAMIVARFYFAGLTFALYCRNHGATLFSSLCGSISYAFSGCMLVAFTESFFVTPMVLFPLLLLGVDRLFQRASPMLLMVASGLFFLSYFYFAYMACLLLVPYSICCYLKYSPKKGVSVFVLWVLKVLGCIIVGAMAAGALLLPIVHVMLGADRLGLDRYVPLLYNFSYYPAFLSGFISVEYLSPDAYIGFGCVGLLALVLLFSRKGNVYAKAAFIGLTVCALLPFAGHVLNGFGYVANRWIWAYAACVSFIIMRMAPAFVNMSAREVKTYAVVVGVLSVLFYLIPNTRNMTTAICMGMAMILAIVLLVWKADMFNGTSQGKEAWLLAILAISVCLPPQLVFAKDSMQMSSEVEHGTAWKSVFEGAPAVTVGGVSDDGLWRYDLASVFRVRNSSDVVGQNSFDFYISIYNGNVDQLLAALELHPSIYNMLITGLDRRSYLESAFGAKYFLVPSGEEDLLPFRCSDTPVTTRTVKGTNSEGIEIETTCSIYENQLALPLAYTFNSTISQEEFDNLSGIQKQQAIMQACAIGEKTSGNASALSFNDFSVPYEIASMDGCEFNEEGNLVTDRPGATLRISFEGVDNSELYIELRGTELTGAPPVLDEPVDLRSLVEYLEDSYLYKEPNDYSIDVTSSDSSSVRLDGLTSKNHMYGGKDDNLINLGYRADREDKVTVELVFDTEGTYSFDELNVIYQPVGELPGLVEQRRSADPVVSAGRNSYTATIDQESESVLMFTVPYSTGWSAKVDGEDAEIMQADIAFMAVDVPAGEHGVELTYVTPMLREGLVLSGIGLMTILVTGIYGAIRKRKRC